MRVLATVRENVHQTLRDLVETADPELRPRFFAAGGKIVDGIRELEHEIFDLHPDLADPERLGVLDEDALTKCVELLERDDPVMRPDLLRQLLAYEPPALVAAAHRAASDEERCILVREWWSAQPRPFRPIDRLDRLLDSNRRWKRFQAARMLEGLGEPALIDPLTGDLNDDAVATWRAARGEQDPE